MQDNSIAVLRLESGPSRATLYMSHIMHDVAIRTIIDPLKSRYTELGAAQSFVDSIKIEVTGPLKFNVLIDHPIAQWLEYGTIKHTIDADEAPYLIFQFRKTSAWFQSHAGDSGNWIKTFQVDHPGFPGYQRLKELLDTLKDNYAREMVDQTNDYLQRSKMI